MRGRPARGPGVDRERIDTLYFTGGASGVPQSAARPRAAARSVEGDLRRIGAGLAVEDGAALR